MLPLRKVRESLTVWHVYLRECLGVHDFVFLDHVVFVEQEGCKSIYLIGLECPLSIEWHPAVDIVPDRHRERRTKRHDSRVRHHVHPLHPGWGRLARFGGRTTFY